VKFGGPIASFFDVDQEFIDEFGGSNYKPVLLLDKLVEYFNDEPFTEVTGNDGKKRAIIVSTFEKLREVLLAREALIDELKLDKHFTN
jgi:hypothetical protein